MPRTGFRLRPEISAVLKKHSWLPMAATAVCALALLAAVAKALALPLVVVLAVAALASSYLSGYSARAIEQTLWPSLDHLERRQYDKVWNALAVSDQQAAEAACGIRNEEELSASGDRTAVDLLRLIPGCAGGDVLEIGCGVGRVGKALAPRCRTWTGADISANMLARAANRLQGISNARLVQLNDTDLQEFGDNSFDAVYSTDMFEHLDEMDRWRYVEEAFRVVRHGGALYFDNFEIESDEGWTTFLNGARRYQRLQRLPYMPRPSTASELVTYAVRAGFQDVQTHYRPPIVVVIATKPADNDGELRT